MRLVVLIPVFDDWTSLQQLLPQLGECLASAALVADVVVVDDWSIEPPSAGLLDQAGGGIASVTIVRLKRNLGHQRAICIGLCHVQAALPEIDAVVVMDGDGEDRPEYIHDLVEAARTSHLGAVVFAARKRRSEGVLFALFYRLYLLLHLVLTGRAVRVGNFSLVPARFLAALTMHPNLWNHFAATIYNSRIPYRLTATARGRRLAGRGKLSFVNLVTHGLSAIACYGETVCVRLLIGSFLLQALLAAAMLALALFGVWGMSPCPWAMAFLWLAFLAVVPFSASALLFCILLLSFRRAEPVPPVSHYQQFIESVHRGRG